MTDKEQKHKMLKARIEGYKGVTNNEKILSGIAAMLLDSYAPNSVPEKDEILEFVRDSLPPAFTFFNEQFYQTPLMTISNLKKAAELYGVDILTDSVYEKHGIPETQRSQIRLQKMVWICEMVGLRREQSCKVICKYADQLTPPHSLENNNPVANSSRQALGEESYPMTPSAESTEGHSSQARRNEEYENQVAELRKSIASYQSRMPVGDKFEPRHEEQDLINRRQPRGPPSDPTMPMFTRRNPRNTSALNAPYNANQATLLQTADRSRSYSSVGHIPNLPKHQMGTSNSGAVSLMKIYSAEHKQFVGSGKLSENFASFHQSYMNHCQTLQLGETEALRNLHVLFKPNSEASIFYHKHVVNVAKTLDEAFYMLYCRFASAERRDRLLDMWNNLSFAEFSEKKGNDKHAALRELCETASMLQLQLGPAYQDDQHLRDTLMNAVKNETWAHQLATMPTSKILDIQESMARAITAEENLDRSRKKTTPALINFSRDRPGLSQRRYEYDNRKGQRRFNTPYRNNRAPDGKNPIRNHMRLLCRECGSDEHLLRDCDKLSAAHRIRFATLILLTDSLCSDSDECNHALDIAQQYGDSAWKELQENLNEDDNEQDIPSGINFSNTYNQDVEEQSYAALADNSFLHSINHNACELLEEQRFTVYESKSESDDFEGICMDDGAQKSLAGLQAYIRYCDHIQIPPKLLPSNEKFRLGNVVHKSMGKVSIRFPIDNHGNFLEYSSDVVDVDIPILFGLDKMKELKWYVNEVTDEFCSFLKPELKVKLVMKLGHLYLPWPTALVLYSRRELLKIHRRFSHPSTTKLMALLERSDPSKIDSDTRKILDDIIARCNSCQRMSKKPFVFQVTMPDNIVFNHEVYLDLMWIEPRPHVPVLHVVDRGTHFSAARFVPNESAEAIWNTFVSCWVSIYVGFPNVLSHDQGSVFTGQFFPDVCAKFGIIQKASPTESHNSLGPGERYHAPLRKIYKKLRIEFPNLDKEVTLNLANHGINITANPEGLIPTLLVFGSIPKIPIGNIDHLCSNQRERFSAMESARKEMERIVASQRLKLATESRAKSVDVFSVAPGEEVLVYREKMKSWEGPYKLYKYDNYKTAYVQMGNGVEPFSISAVKKYLIEEETEEENTGLAAKQPTRALPQVNDKVEVFWPKDDKYYPGLITKIDERTNKRTVHYDDGDKELLDFSGEKWRLISNTPPTSPKNTINLVFDLLREKQGYSACSASKVYVSIIVDDPSDPRFLESSRKEIQGLLDRGTYVVVNEKDVPSGATVLRSRVVHTIKTDPDGNDTFKTRLVIQGHLDPEKGRVVNEAPTILRSSSRIILSIAESLGLSLWSRDVKQAFIQSDEELKRDLYIRPPRKPNLLEMIDKPPGLLHAIKPLYGLAESPGYWWQTFKRYHVSDLGMTQTILDPCFFFKKKDGELIGLIGTLVDDTLAAGTPQFSIEEESKSSKFDVKDREQSMPLQFGGSEISRTSHGLLLSQQSYANKLDKISPNQFTPEEFAHLRGQLAYVATSTRPDVAYINAKLAQVPAQKATPADVRLLNSAVTTLQKHTRGLKFPKLDKDSIKIRGYADAGFATNEDHSSQLGMLIVLTDKFNKAAIIHYSSWKCRRITRSILAAEVYALSACYDYCTTLAVDMESILNKPIPVEIFTDSKSIFDTVTKLTSVTEKRLLIDLSALREAYTSGAIQNLGHVLTEYNIADPLTKKMRSNVLIDLLDTGTLSHPINQWIIHSTPEPSSDVKKSK